MIELSVAERDLLKKILGSYLSELRQAIAATKRDTSPPPCGRESSKGTPEESLRSDVTPRWCWTLDRRQAHGHPGLTAATMLVGYAGR